MDILQRIECIFDCARNERQKTYSGIVSYDRHSRLDRTITADTLEKMYTDAVASDQREVVLRYPTITLGRLA